ncbi:MULTISPECIES: DUF1822 family protein [Moorena]|uniref:DUF1822 family protein n=1 Tax=Moorena producens 3L TaxID=489825 RepID=F4XVL5_9CYAN|nr:MULTISPECIES: DUF1822 family protein [Moorena]NEQ14183.1 DUF1822 family protein [Moorena sp. SIO3E2]NES81267.1 DUF1822 family protein [Moorena sp. SIO2B7]EGJ31278.1 protein of unknown function, DUF1822 [Moorena producens 3L]NEP34326.1 DUF1822 family protein [Moorena sp. SIO3B2]NEP70126.1 DUF1822 family protein [Moorena sp. SIO3A5]
MTYNTHNLEQFALPLPITDNARRSAEQFARQQPTSEKAEQVRLNTLAVLVVNDYMQMLGMPTDLKASDSWNPIIRLLANVADLEISDIGRIECRPIKAQDSLCHIPPEVWCDRIGYVVVQIDEQSSQGTVLGFTPTADTEELPISQLRPVDDLIDQFHQPISELAQRTRVNLSQWLDNVVETGWQTLESLENLLNPPEPIFAFRSSGLESTEALPLEENLDVGIRRAKLIDLGLLLAGSPVALVVELLPESELKQNICLKVYPTGSKTYLPPNLTLTVLDGSGTVFLEAQARQIDNYIQLQFSGLPGEQFSVEVALGDARIIEDFAI